MMSLAALQSAVMEAAMSPSRMSAATPVPPLGASALAAMPSLAMLDEGASRVYQTPFRYCYQQGPVKEMALSPGLMESASRWMAVSKGLQACCYHC
jgi:hypothetical protein